MMKRVLTPSSAHLLIVAGLLAACDTGPVEGAIEPADEGAVESIRPSVNALASDARPSAQLPGFDLSIELVGDNVELSWDGTEDAQYQVWQSTYPYFTPGESGSYLMDTVLPDEDGEIEFTVLNGNDDAAANAYYRVQNSETLETSTAVGRHRLTMWSGFNKIPLSLETDIATTEDAYGVASEGAEYIHQRASHIDAWNWLFFVTWNPDSDVPQAIFEGVPPVAQMNIPTDPEGEPTSVVRAIAGYVPERNSFSIPLPAGQHLVHLPLDFPTITASELFEAMLPYGVWEVGRWQAAEQARIMVNTIDPEVDVEIRPGDDLYIVMGADTQWPIDRTEVSGDCCEANGNAYCNDNAVTECVCAADSYCCSNTWDSTCANEVNSLGCGTCEAEPPPPPPEPGNCCEATAGVSGCTDPVIEACVCAQDDYCCSVAWDSICVGEVELFGCSDVCVAEA